MTEDLKKNVEGYSDPTPYEALENIKNNDDSLSRDQYLKFKHLINTIFYICNLAGIRIESRLVLRDTNTGKVWK